jgi:hypothetical protein
MAGRVQMKKLIGKKTGTKHKPTIHSQLDSHTWATKMEIRQLLSGKRDLRLEPVERKAL